MAHMSVGLVLSCQSVSLLLAEGAAGVCVQAVDHYQQLLPGLQGELEDAEAKLAQEKASREVRPAARPGSKCACAVAHEEARTGVVRRKYNHCNWIPWSIHNIRMSFFWKVVVDRRLCAGRSKKAKDVPWSYGGVRYTSTLAAVPSAVHVAEPSLLLVGVGLQSILPSAAELCPESDVTERCTNPDKVKAKMDRLEKKIKAQEAR